MNLYRSYDPGREFNRLTRFDSSYFFLFATFFNFFYFIIKYWVGQKLGFVNFFHLLFMGLSQSHRSGHKFEKLTRVNSIC